MRFKNHHFKVSAGKKFHVPVSADVPEQGSNEALPSPQCLTQQAKRNTEPSTFNLQPSTRQSGIALVITLILLSVTLVMAVAFLAISRRERGSVTTGTDTAVAKGASQAALAEAEAQIVSDILTTTNPYLSRLIVSTNYINSQGFNSPAGANPTNVNYDHYTGGGSLNNAVDFEQNIANLFLSPRPPVYFSNDFRFYLDLNRNGRYDTNGVVTNFDNGLNGLGSTSVQVGDPEWIGILEHPDAPHGPNNPFIARYCFIAVPADSLDLNHIHNQVFAAPSGISPVIVNQPLISDAYARNQGVGTWEMNLAAFLTDLNTNRWDPAVEPYRYPEGLAGSSVAFDDARALVAWRYGNNYKSLATIGNTFTNLFNYPFNIDVYSLGFQTTLNTNFEIYYNTKSYGPTLPWAGSLNSNTFFASPSDLFNTNKALFGASGWSQFATNLFIAGTSNATYDRYTFYRLLSQMGSDSSQPPEKLNLNFQNAIVNYQAGFGIITNLSTAITYFPDMETNFISWQPRDFFTAAADKLLRAYTTEWFESSPSNYIQTFFGITTNYTLITAQGLTNFPAVGMTNQIPSFGITNIPVLVNGQFAYTPAVNRLLQLAANIYDSTTNTSTLTTSNYPSVFRPIFWTTNELNTFGFRETNVYIKGYEYVPQTPPTNGFIFSFPVELTVLPFGLDDTNVWGVPWIIGAKKGLPNFNGFELENTFFIARELQFNRTPAIPSTGAFPYGRVYTTNQMYIMGISNLFAVEDWNSYAAPYNNHVTIVAQDDLTMGLTNDAGVSIINPFFTNGVYQTALTPSGVWPGTSPTLSSSFILPLGTNVFVAQNLGSPSGGPPSTNNLYEYYYTPTTRSFANSFGTYNFTGPCFIPLSLNPSNYLDHIWPLPPLPQFGLEITNHLQAYILETDPSGNVHILDYVQLGSMNSRLNISQAIADPSSAAGFWNTNTDYYGGVNQQYLVSAGGPGLIPAADTKDAEPWNPAPVPGVGAFASPAAQAAFFAAFFSASDIAPYPGGLVTNFQPSIQAPYTPMRTVIQRFALRANDPLVHYTSGDLNDFQDDTSNIVAMTTPPAGLKYLGHGSDRYLPWGDLLPGQSAIVNQLQASFLYGDPPTPLTTDHINIFNLSYKDPLVSSSGNWDFPTNKYSGVGLLGRVHRGTPWQSVFLKSTNILALVPLQNGAVAGAATWQVWTGNPNANDAYNASPMQDRLLFDLFTTTLSDEASRGQLSVNIGADDPNNPLAGLASWSALLSGAVALATNVPDSTLSLLGFKQFQNPAPSTLPVVILPAGLAGTNINFSPLEQIVQGINGTRTNWNTPNIEGLTNVNVDGLHGVFEHVGDVLRAPQLSDASPFLSGDLVQQQKGISDEMYEWLPQQIMSLLTVSGTPQSPPRYVVYCYGQTLKPAPNGIVNGGAFFGLCTNYQVTAETASRVVIHVENTPTPANPTATPHVVIEQFNPLPPD